jgi:hypothetical protein
MAHTATSVYLANYMQCICESAGLHAKALVFDYLENVEAMK